MAKLKKKNKYIVMFAVLTTAFFIWLFWEKVSDLLGNSNLTFVIVGVVVVILVYLGYVTPNGIFKRIG